MDLGDDVIEDIRLHRVVFCKSMNVRWFADAKPAESPGVIRININHGWRKPIQTVNMDRNGVTAEIKNVIADAYNALH